MMNIVICTTLLVLISISCVWTKGYATPTQHVGEMEPTFFCDSTNALRPHPDDSKTFYVCAEAIKGPRYFQYSCPEGTEFDTKLNSCTPAHDTDPGHLPKLKERPLAEAVLSQQCTIGELHCTNCSYFQICVSNEGGNGTHDIDLPCPRDTFCDPNDGVCKSRVPACQDENPFQCGSDGTFPDTTNCGIYHVCFNGSDTAYNCPDGKAFNPGTLLCDRTKDQTTCYQSIASLPKYHVRGDCLSYYQVMVSRLDHEMLVSTFFSCGPGEAFAVNDDPTKSYCERNVSKVTDFNCRIQLAEAGVVCFEPGINFRPGNECPTKAYYCGKQLDLLGVVSCPEGQGFIDSTDCKDFEEVKGCQTLCQKGQKEMANLDDCTTYFECGNVTAVPVVTKCGSNKAFNTATGHCDHIDNVPRCKKQVHPSTY